ncbi:hypothetical protein LTR86_006482 [Recurvomyces mirabilis]|nr:hypothetical protein LTR86_006482 [Recurvomyces mirabilis]
MALQLTGRPSIVPAVQEVPSPASSTDSLDTRGENEEGQQQQIISRRERPGGRCRNAHSPLAATAGTATTKIRNGRAKRSPSRLPLRTVFRNSTEVVEVFVGGGTAPMTSPTSEKSGSSSKSSPMTYAVHKELLTSASPFFAAALNGTFAEGLDQAVKLPEEKPEIFEWFLQWLYTGSLSVAGESGGFNTGWGSGGADAHAQSHDHSHATPHHPYQQTRHVRDAIDAQIRTDGDLRNHAGSPKYFLLIDLYALSDRVLTTQLSNHILSTLARLSETTNSVPTPSDTFILYDSIRDTSPLRTLILDLFAYKKTDKLLETHKDDWHPRFLRELVVKLKRPGAGTETVERHDLHAWRPEQWSATRPCEGCREVVKPGVLSFRV